MVVGVVQSQVKILLLVVIVSIITIGLVVQVAPTIGEVLEVVVEP